MVVECYLISRLKHFTYCLTVVFVCINVPWQQDNINNIKLNKGIMAIKIIQNDDEEN